MQPVRKSNAPAYKYDKQIEEGTYSSPVIIKF